jgi:hypothetical protein
MPGSTVELDLRPKCLMEQLQYGDRSAAVVGVNLIVVLVRKFVVTFPRPY